MELKTERADRIGVMTVFLPERQEQQGEHWKGHRFDDTPSGTHGQREGLFLV
jgi:hypothetical protein